MLFFLFCKWCHPLQIACISSNIWRKGYGKIQNASFIFQYEFRRNRWSFGSQSFLYPGSNDQTKNNFCELILDISQDFEIFKCSKSSVSLLEKQLNWETNLVQFANGASVLFRVRSGFLACFLEGRRSWQVQVSELGQSPAFPL